MFGSCCVTSYILVEVVNVDTLYLKCFFIGVYTLGYTAHALLINFLTPDLYCYLRSLLMISFLSNTCVSVMTISMNEKSKSQRVPFTLDKSG
jgi:hypothetical protein